MLTVNLHPFTILKTSRLTLRQVRKEDAYEIFLLRSDKRVMKYISKPLATSLNDAFQWIQVLEDTWANNDGITWGISFNHDKKLIGTIGIWKIIKEHHRGEVGYSLLPDHQRKGIMQEALKAVLDFGFNVLQLHSLEANASPENEASLKLLEKNNFIREGYFKENYFFEGRFSDTVTYSLLASKTSSL